MIKNIIIAILSVLLLILGISVYFNYKKLTEYENQIASIGLKEQTFINVTDKSGDTISQQKQLILTPKQADKLDLIKDTDLKDISSQIQIKTVTKIDSIFIPYKVYDTIYKSFDLKNEFYSLGGKVDKNGVILDSFNIFNKTSVTVGMKSKGIFKKPEPIVTIKHNNPYIKTKGLSNIIIKDEQKWYDRKLFWFGTGIISGVTISLIAK